MNIDNHDDTNIKDLKIVLSPIKKNCRKISFHIPSKSPKTFTELNYTGNIRKKIKCIFV